MLELIFWLCALALVHSYVLYPLSLLLFDRREEIRDAQDTEPAFTVSILVAAHNEAACIVEKIRNAARLAYPRGKLEMLIGDDGSTDATAQIVAQAGADFVRLIRAPRGGKAAMLNRLATEAHGEILVFTDANTMLEPGALAALVRPLRDPRVGCVCGHLKLTAANDAGRSEGLYWRYETRIKELESHHGVALGVAGGLYAIRRRLFRALPTGMVVDDFVVSMRAALAGFEVRDEPRARAHEEASNNFAAEFRRRVRIAAGNWRGLSAVRELLAPSAGFVAYALWSHKVLRWCGPVLLAAALVSSAALAATPLYAALLAVQVAFYLLALAHFAGLRLPGAALARHFVEMNAALALGTWKYLRGSMPATWTPTEHAVR